MNVALYIKTDRGYCNESHTSRSQRKISSSSRHEAFDISNTCRYWTRVVRTRVTGALDTSRGPHGIRDVAADTVDRLTGTMPCAAGWYDHPPKQRRTSTRLLWPACHACPVEIGRRGFRRREARTSPLSWPHHTKHRLDVAGRSLHLLDATLPTHISIANSATWQHPRGAITFISSRSARARPCMV